MSPLFLPLNFFPLSDSNYNPVKKFFLNLFLVRKSPWVRLVFFSWKSISWWIADQVSLSFSFSRSISVQVTRERKKVEKRNELNGKENWDHKIGRYLSESALVIRSSHLDNLGNGEPKNESRNRLEMKTQDRKLERERGWMEIASWNEL